MSVRDLRAHAQDVGVGNDEIEDARDGDDPREELIALIVDATM